MIVFPALPTRNFRMNVVYAAPAMSVDDCDRIRGSAKDEAWEAGLVGSKQDGKAGFAAKANVRSMQQQPLPLGNQGYPLGHLAHHICNVNGEHWGFDLSGFVADDHPWIMKYSATNRDHYDWHVDLGKSVNASRKLGFSLQLSDSGDYEGGDLEFLNLNMDRETLRRKSTLIVFPAYWTHRVTPVTRGTRYAVVGWVHGPSFR